MKTTRKPAEFSAQVTIPITRDQIECLLAGAMEGGSTYWAALAVTVVEEEDFYTVAPYQGGIDVTVGDTGPRDPRSNTTHRLDAAAIRRGFQIMADTQPRHMADFMAQHDDSTTADVWLQCCLFGEVIYG